MTSAITRDTLYDLMAAARGNVLIVGVVPLDLDWDRLLDAFTDRSSGDNLTITLYCESDNQLFGASLLTDSAAAPKRRSYHELKFIRDRAIDIDNSTRAPSPSLQVSAVIQYLSTPLCIVSIDGSMLAAPLLFDTEPVFNTIDADHPWRSSVETYLLALTADNRGGRYCARPGTEVLELYDHERTPRGIFPRSAFYDTDFSQLVVWAFVFDRTGRLLIHRRAKNAKDNRGMWDKSVGGHVDVAEDIDSSRAAARELLEELYTEELTDDREWNPFLTVRPEEIVFLGEWDPSRRDRTLFEEINKFEDRWYIFRLPSYHQVFSPRRLPDNGGIRRLRTIADVFLVIGGRKLVEGSLKKLRNSSYRLIGLDTLKSAMEMADSGQILEEWADEAVDEAVDEEVPEFTPDLANVMTGGLRGDIELFSQYAKRYLVRSNAENGGSNHDHGN